jgi:hypothetical protein
MAATARILTGRPARAAASELTMAEFVRTSRTGESAGASAARAS